MSGIGSAYSLAKIKRVFNHSNKLMMTYSAKHGQIELGFSDQDVVDAIQALTEKDFYKSMPPKTPGFVGWQDVYKSCFKEVELYIKFQVNNRKELILSFKEL